MKSLLKYPPVMHGLLAGLVLVLVKFVFYFSGHWLYKVDQRYMLLSFVLLMVAMYLSSTGLRKLRGKISYWQAFFAALRTIVIALFLSLLAEQLVYRLGRPGLAQELKDYTIMKQEQTFEKFPIFGKSTNAMMEQIKEVDAKEQYSLISMLAAWFTYSFMNGLFAFLIAAMTQRSASESVSDNPNVLP